MTLTACYLQRMTFGVDPDTHIDTVEQAKASTIEGTSKWSCKLSITGTNDREMLSQHLHLDFVRILLQNKYQEKSNKDALI